MNQTEQILHNQAIIMKALTILIQRCYPCSSYENSLIEAMDIAILKSEQEHGYER